MKNKFLGYLIPLIIAVMAISLSSWFVNYMIQGRCTAVGKMWNVKNSRCEQVLAASKIPAANTTYAIDDEPIRLINGVSQVPITTDYSILKTTLYFGNEAKGDLNGDGQEDTALILTQNLGGSGTFYYVAVALASNQWLKGLNAVLLGDRIAPQTTEIKDGQVIVNYADRAVSESFADSPTIAVTKYLKVVNDNLQVIENVN